MRRFENRSGRGLYRSRDGVILGVCRGIAEYFDFSVFWVRTITIIVLFCSGLWPIAGLYFIAALVMKPEPVIPILTEDEQEFYDSYTHSRRGAVNRVRRRYDNLERRIRRIEDTVTSREFDWDRRIEN
ncbi:envelope stress response membrane protein PspC [Desulfonema magnum]|uniref:Phage shock protein C n=1 Tax=Desulfonema magnum TaxID=45655 RepID=A0A975BVR3_9BACT|nr:envelope stress response membrane protein PspC [Desulfonema magnum]QTA92646.1 Phage shock protein C [Desulfonema magnum]